MKPYKPIFTEGLLSNIFKDLKGVWGQFSSDLEKMKQKELIDKLNTLKDRAVEEIKRYNEEIAALKEELHGDDDIPSVEQAQKDGKSSGEVDRVRKEREKLLKHNKDVHKKIEHLQKEALAVKETIVEIADDIKKYTKKKDTGKGEPKKGEEKPKEKKAPTKKKGEGESPKEEKPKEEKPAEGEKKKKAPAKKKKKKKAPPKEKKETKESLLTPYRSLFEG